MLFTDFARRKYLKAAMLASTGLVASLGMSQTNAQSTGALDLNHQAFDALLKKHVAWNQAGTASTVNYKELLDQHADLKVVLASYSAVTKSSYDALRKDDKLAFLINAYNAFTLELILTKYPNLKSIKDLGTVFQAPWKNKFFKLLGEDRHLDNVEHDMIRAPGVFEDPRIHFAVVCASIGCPALRPEAFTGAKLEAQLEDGARRFLRDKTRNRFNAASGKLEVSKIFDWYKVDFEKNWKGVASREAFFGKYAELLAATPEQQALVRDGKAPLAFLDYNWNLNDKK